MSILLPKLRCTVVLALPFLALTGATPEEAAEARCRCASRDLADYYATAAEVAMARLVSFEDQNTNYLFRMVLEAPAWKAAAVRGPDRLPRGDTVEYRTAISTATCGVPPEPNAVYIVFGQRAPDEGILHLDTCSGTRVYRLPDGQADPGGFRDVPGRFVLQQLNALGALDALDGVASLPDAAAQDSDVLRGLLDLEPLAHGGIVRVFAEPDPGAPLLATVGSAEALVTLEVDYELPAAVVYGRIDGWSRIRLTDDRSGWIAPEDSGTWFPYAELPLRRLAYLTQAWTGYVWSDPGAGVVRRFERAPGHEREQPVEVLESRQLAGVPWFRVSVLRSSPCEGPERARPVAGGWVPGYGAVPGTTGLRPTLWYWSRGC